MNPIFAGMAIQAIGGLFGGRKKKKAAKQLAAKIDASIASAVEQVGADQDMAKAIRADDEARLKAATGYDLAKLRDQAEAAGFNPLTVLEATGGAGYDGRGAVLTTPFVYDKAGVMMHGADLQAGVGQAVVDRSGYVGDVIAGVGSGIVDYGNTRAQQRHEMVMLETTLRGNTSSPGAIRGTRVAGGKRGRTPPLVGGQVAVPGANTYGPPFQHKEWVFTPGGTPFQIDASWMRRNTYEPGDYLQPGDYEQWLGESGQAASLGYGLPMYKEMAGSQLDMGREVAPGQTRFSPRTNATRPVMSGGWW